MGQTSSPLSPQSQKLNQIIAPMPGSFFGLWTYTFQPAPFGFTFTGTLVVPNAPPGCAFEVLVAGNSVGTWQGNNTFGPIQALGGQTIAVIAISPSSLAAVPMIFQGSSDPTDLAAATWPDTMTNNITVTATLPGAVSIDTTPGSPINAVYLGGNQALLKTCNVGSPTVGIVTNLLPGLPSGSCYVLTSWSMSTSIASATDAYNASIVLDLSDSIGVIDAIAIAPVEINSAGLWVLAMGRLLGDVVIPNSGAVNIGIRGGIGVQTSVGIGLRYAVVTTPVIS